MAAIQDLQLLVTSQTVQEFNQLVDDMIGNLDSILVTFGP